MVSTNETGFSESTTLILDGTGAYGTGTIDSRVCCPYRLPCGYCTKIDKPCPMVCAKVEPTW